MKHEEEDIQEAFTSWFRLQYPSVIGYAIPNGGNRNLREAARLKRQGVLAGVPDFHIAQPKMLRQGNDPILVIPGLFLEFKSKKGRLSPAQERVCKTLSLEGYLVSVVRSLDEAMKVTRAYLNALEPIYTHNLVATTRDGVVPAKPVHLHNNGDRRKSEI